MSNCKHFVLEQKWRHQQQPWLSRSPKYGENADLYQVWAFTCFRLSSPDFLKLFGQLRPQHVELRTRLQPLRQRYSAPGSAERKAFKWTPFYFVCPLLGCGGGIFFLKVFLFADTRKNAVTFQREPSIMLCLDRRSEAQHALFQQISNTVGKAHMALPAIINSLPASPFGPFGSHSSACSKLLTLGFSHKSKL